MNRAQHLRGFWLLSSSPFSECWHFGCWEPPVSGCCGEKRHRAEQHLVPSLARFRSQQKLTDTDELVASSLYFLAVKLDECGPQPGCEVEMYRDGSKALDALEEAIDAAQEHIHLTYYTWEADNTGRRFCQALTRAAGRGVEVRLLLDDVGSYSTKTSFFAAEERSPGFCHLIFLAVRFQLITVTTVK